MFANYITRFSSIATKHGAFINYPKIVLEMSAIIIIFSSLILINYSNFDLKSMIPFFGVFIAGAFRLLPSVNKLMQSFNNISFHKTSIDMMIKEYNKEFHPRFSRENSHNNNIEIGHGRQASRRVIF